MRPESQLLISCDWGTSSFRLRLLQGRERPKVLADRSSSRGIATFSPSDADEFREYLILEIDRLFRGAKMSPEAIPVYLSGMITSSLGWVELAYAELPFPLDGSRARVERTELQRVYGYHSLNFISGVRSEDDVMRGEETELMGILREPAMKIEREECIAILPGTHSKIIQIRGGSIIGFRTYLTGELFEILQKHSILRHSIDTEAGAARFSPLPKASREHFEEGVRRAAEGSLLESLFSVRTNQVLKGMTGEHNALYLSGLLIGAEASSVLRNHSAPLPILLCGSPILQNLYRCAYHALGAEGRLRVVPEKTTSLAAALGHWEFHRATQPRERHQDFGS
jgi:2-dehydro-3-deoxygalactonokinase